jgi:Ca2+-binding EF-hand superfamily protein
MPAPVLDTKTSVFKDVFNEFDLDSSGTINVSELGAAVRKLSGGLPVSDPEIETMMTNVDSDASGDIGFEEFCKMMAARSDPVEEMKAAFSTFDIDGSGSISAAEVRAEQTAHGALACSLVLRGHQRPFLHCPRSRRPKSSSTNSASRSQTLRLTS